MSDDPEWLLNLRERRRQQIAPVVQEFTPYLQAAGLKPIDITEVRSPQELRDSCVQALKQALPASAPQALRVGLSQSVIDAAPEIYSDYVQQVKDATMKIAHSNPTMREIVTQDRTGRTITEFVGNKSIWMAPFKAEVQQMVGIGGRPFP